MLEFIKKNRNGDSVSFLIDVDFWTKVSKGQTAQLSSAWSWDPVCCWMRAPLGSALVMCFWAEERLLSGGHIPGTLRHSSRKRSPLLAELALPLLPPTLPVAGPAGVCWREGRLAVMGVIWQRTRPCWIAAGAEWPVIEKELIAALQNEIQRAHCKLDCPKPNF